jgi:hypothetical protein
VGPRSSARSAYTRTEGDDVTSPDMICKPHRIPACQLCSQKPHGPVSERLMRLFYGPAKAAPASGVLLKKGTLIHINGMPFRLLADVRADGHAANLPKGTE